MLKSMRIRMKSVSLSVATVALATGTVLWSHAAPDLFLPLDGTLDPVVAEGMQARRADADPAGAPVWGEGWRGRGQAAVFGDRLRKIAYDGTLDRNKAMTVLMVARLDLDPAQAGDARHWLLDAGGGAGLYDALGIQCSGLGLSMRSARSVKDGNGIFVDIPVDDLPAGHGQWLFVAFSCQPGKGWGCVADLDEASPVVWEARVGGNGDLCGEVKRPFVVGNRGEGGTVNDVNGVAIDQLAVYRRALSPQEIAGVFRGLRSGQDLGQDAEPVPDVKVREFVSLPKDLHEPQRTRVETPKMVLEFDDGQLVRWENRETGETVAFGRVELDRERIDDRPYAPGPWWADWRAPHDPGATGTDWSTQVDRVDDTAVALSQTAQRKGDREVQAVQWSVRIPYDQVDAVHFPKGMPPARMSGTGTLDMFLAKNHQFRGRLAEDSGGGAWRLRFYQIQGKTGGLLVYMDDPGLDHYANLEFRKGDNELLVSNRSFCPPPWKDRYTGGRWVIRQYSGPTSVGAQFYQDYLARAYKLVPLKDRPTAWVKNLGYVFVQAPWCEPLPLPGLRRPSYNFSSNWEESIQAGVQWLENLAKVLPPDQVMIYTTDWRTIPDIDRGLQDNAVDPFFAIMCRKARRMGFHVMLHFQCINLTTETVCYERYFKHQAALLGLPGIQGVVHNAYRGTLMGEDRGEGSPPTSWPVRSGFNRRANEFTMNMAFEGWRRFYVGSVLAAIAGSGADALHLDVPIAIPDLNTPKYGMNAQQGMREFGRLLRQTLDENGFAHVAIGTEVTPPEALLPYVDYAQVTRGKSVTAFLDGILQGKYRATDDAMILVQTGADLVATKAQREQQQRERALHFDREQVAATLAVMRELGEPSINSMVVGPYVQAGPHLGCLGSMASVPGQTAEVAAAYNQLVQSMDVWFSMTHDTVWHGSGSRAMFMDTPPFDGLETIQRYRKDANNYAPLRKNGKVLGEFDYVKFAMARFWAQRQPQLLPPGRWEKGDIGRYVLKDGRVLRVVRSGPTTLRWAFDDGTVLAELDLLDGWRETAMLLREYEPSFLKNQIDEFATVANEG